MTSQLSNEQLKDMGAQPEKTKVAAQKVENVLKESAALLVEAKESMILAMLKKDVDTEMISITTKTPIDLVESICLKMQK